MKLRKRNGMPATSKATITTGIHTRAEPMSPIFITRRKGTTETSPITPIRTNGFPRKEWIFGRSCISQAIITIPEVTPSCAGWKLSPAMVRRWTSSSACIAITIRPRLTTYRGIPSHRIQR